MGAYAWVGLECEVEVTGQLLVRIRGMPAVAVEVHFLLVVEAGCCTEFA